MNTRVSRCTAPSERTTGGVRHVCHNSCPLPHVQPRQRPRNCRAAAQDALVRLGGSDLKVSRLGLGTLQWGDPQNGFGQRFDEPALQQIFEAALGSGINFFDTAEVYGYQNTKNGASSEHILGRCLKKQNLAPRNTPIVVGTKFFTIPWTNFLIGGGFRLGRDSVLKALRVSLERLQVSSVPLYQVHFPFPFFSQELLADAMTQLHQEGTIKAVGVCNYNPDQMRTLHGLLAKQGIPLASNQVKFSILEQQPVKSGLVQACKDLNVSLVAHSPLAQGLLTDKQLADNSKAEKVKPVLKLMSLIGTLTGGRSVTQVALNYLMQKGAIPIPGCKGVQQLRELAGALEFDLDDNEVAMIEERLAAL